MIGLGAGAGAGRSAFSTPVYEVNRRCHSPTHAIAFQICKFSLINHQFVNHAKNKNPKKLENLMSRR
jgi:hypothetical protein